MAGVSQLPVEVLHQIFGLLKRQRILYKTNAIPQYHLASLIRVCKHWQPIAERLLYQSVAIGSDLYHDDVYTTAIDDNPYIFMSGEYIYWLYTQLEDARECNVPFRRASHVIRHFLETLQKNQRLAAFVIELQLIIPDEHESNSDEDAHRSAKILAACPNVKHVQIIFGLNPFAVESLTESLTLKKSLVSFRVNHPEGEDSDTRLWTAPTLLRMMRKWRQIEHVEISPYALSSNVPDDDEGDDEAELNCCPKLQSLVLCQGHHEQAMLRSLDLRNLLRMCPAGIKIFKASLAMDDGTLEALGDCLRAWAPTLEILNLSKSVVSETSSSFPPLSDCVSDLLRLKVLALETLIMDPSALSILPNLKDLCVSSPSGRGRRDLLIALNEPNKFSALRTIYIAFVKSALDSEEIMLHNKFIDSIEHRGITYHFLNV